MRRYGLPAMGLATPLGCTKAEVARNLFAGTRDGLVWSGDYLPGRLIPVGAVTAELPPLPAEAWEFDCRNNRLMLLALRQIEHEIDEARSRFGADRIAVILGTSTSGIAEGEAAFAAQAKAGVWPAGFHYCQQEAGSLSECAARCLGVTGPAYTIATACSSSAKVFAAGRRLIAAGIVDACIVGGADTLCRMTLNGFDSLEALSPELCQPFSANRKGINIGEAAAAFLMTRDEAPVLLAGVGETSDAYHVSAPDPKGQGAIAAMRQALADAGLAPADIAYVNLHGTATPLNDAMEGQAVEAVFGSRTPCSSTKAMTGHTLGAAGACEAAFLWLCLHPDTNPQGLLPPHMWDGVPDPGIPALALVRPGTRMRDDLSAMLSSNFAFGGSNAALVFTRGGAS